MVKDRKLFLARAHTALLKSRATSRLQMAAGMVAALNETNISEPFIYSAPPGIGVWYKMSLLGEEPIVIRRAWFPNLAVCRKVLTAQKNGELFLLLMFMRSGCFDARKGKGVYNISDGGELHTFAVHADFDSKAAAKELGITPKFC